MDSCRSRRMLAVLHVLLLAFTVWPATAQDVPTGPCALNPCQNSGVCQVDSSGTGFLCACVGGYTGRLCEVSPCSDPGTPSNGQRSPPSSRITWIEGSTLTFSCYAGFNLVGNSSMTCVNGAWNASHARCHIVLCYPAAVSSNTQYTYSHGPLPTMPRYVYNTTVAYTCSAGYRVTSGDSLRRCTAAGTWSGSAPSCDDFCTSTVCPRDTDPTNTTWTSCCKFLGQSVQCCRPGVQQILDDRFKGVGDRCTFDLQNKRIFAGCTQSLVTCLNLQKSSTVSGCTDIYGCTGIRDSLANCQGTFGSGALLCNSTLIQRSGLTEMTSFCLPPSCGTGLGSIARSDFLVHCDTLTKLGGASSCPIVRVNIDCPGANGTYDIGDNPNPASSGLSAGAIAGIIIGVLLCLALLVVVIVLCRKNGRPNPAKKDDSDGCTNLPDNEEQPE